MSFIKKLSLLFLIFIASCLQGNAQQKILQVHHEFRDRPWLDQQAHQIWGHKVTMLFGEKYSLNRYANVRQTTGIGYQDLNTTLDSLSSRAVKENWTADSLDNAKDWYRQHSSGGRLFVFLARYEEDAASTRFMVLSINGPDDKEQILRAELPYQAPELPEGYGWWNYIEVPLSKDLPPEFFVYLKRTTNVNPIAGFRIEPSE